MGIFNLFKKKEEIDFIHKADGNKSGGQKPRNL